MTRNPTESTAGPETPPPPAGDLDLSVVGLGNMGGAVLGAALETGILDPRRVGVHDRDEGRTTRFTALGCRPLDLAGTGTAPRILLAVKPQVFPDLSPTLRSTGDGQRRVAISVMAGLPSTAIADALGEGTAVVRAMPNTPASIRLGATAIAAGPQATAEDLAWTRRLFESVGTVVDVDESLFHVVTAVSGSGPAWVFRLAEGWIAAATREGLPPETATRLVTETLFGAASLVRAGEASPAALREAVTSRGGTTAAGLEALGDRDFDGVIAAAIRAAVARGEELGR